MRKYTIPGILAAFALLCASCTVDEVDRSVTVVSSEHTARTALDAWLDANYRIPYNIDFKYRFEDIEGDYDYYLVPARYDESIKMAHLVKYLCVEAYDEVAGVDFTRAYFPKMFFLEGDFEYNANNTMVLGTAEGGKKIILMGVNYLSSISSQHDAGLLNEYYFKTIHHEFTHILNQTKDYPTAFQQVTGSGYVADNWSTNPYALEYLEFGFISAYSQKEAREDFAEMLSTYVINPQSTWDRFLSQAGTSGRAAIQAKLEIVRNYMRDSWGIDIDELRAVILRRQDEILSGRVDITDLTVR